MANLDDFLAWRGAEPFDPSLATELHHWDQFTAELPAAWRPDGPVGQQYIADADLGSAAMSWLRWCWSAGPAVLSSAALGNGISRAPTANS